MPIGPLSIAWDLTTAAAEICSAVMATRSRLR